MNDTTPPTPSPLTRAFTLLEEIDQGPDAPPLPLTADQYAEIMALVGEAAYGGGMA